MSLLDFFILIPIGYFAWKGFMSGLIREVFSIVGIVLAVFLTFEYMNALSVIFKPFFNNPDHAIIGAGIFIFIATIAGTQFLAYTTQKLLELIKVNFINRLAGLVFGSLKAGIVISAFLLLMAGFNLPSENARNNSISYPVVIYIAPAVFNMVATIYPGAESFIETIEKTIEENNPIRTLPIFEGIKI